MDQIPIRVLNQDTAGVLARVQNGESIVITNRGHAIARLVPVAADSLADLVASGLVLPPTLTGPIPVPRVDAANQPLVASVLVHLVATNHRSRRSAYVPGPASPI